MKKCILIFIFLFLTRTIIACDDDDFSPIGAIPIPKYDVNIQLVKVKINIDNKKNFYNCHYTFKNHGETTNIVMCFPEFARHKGEKTLLKDFQVLQTRKRFLVFTSKKKIQVKHQFNVISKLSGCNSYYSWNIPFKKGETITIINKYFTLAGGGSWVHYHAYHLPFTLRTGLFWKGVIENIELNISFEDYTLIEGLFGSGNAIDNDTFNNYLNKADQKIKDDPWDYFLANLKSLEDGKSITFKVNNTKPWLDIDLRYHDKKLLLSYSKNPQVSWGSSSKAYNIQNLINSIYARNGYYFKKKTIFNYYKNFKWYDPDSDIKLDDFNSSDKEFIIILKKMLKKYKEDNEYR